MQHADGRSGQQFGHEVAVADGIQAVGGGAVEAQILGQALTIDVVGRAGQCARTQRAAQHAIHGVAEAVGIAPQHLDVGQAPVREQHGLRALHVREAGEHRVFLALGEFQQALVGRVDLGQTHADLLHAPQAQVGADLVVAAAAGVQLLAEVAHARDQFTFHPAVHILVGCAREQFGIAGCQRADLSQRLLQACAFVLGDHARAADGRGPRHRALHVLLHQATIEGQAVVEHAEERVLITLHTSLPDRCAHRAAPPFTCTPET